MSTVRDELLGVRDALVAAGVRATCDPADAHPPAVLLRVASARRTGCGWLASCEAVMVAPGPAADPLWPWGELLDRLVVVLGAEDDPTSNPFDEALGVPTVTVPFRLTT